MSTRRIQGMSLLMNLSVPGEGAADTCKWDMLLRSDGLKVRLAQGNCVGEFKGKGRGRVFGNHQR